MKRFKTVLSILDVREHSQMDWGMAFFANRVLAFLIGFPIAVAFACVCWVLADLFVPVASRVTFWGVWENLAPERSLSKFLDALDYCALGNAWLQRVDIIAAFSGLLGWLAGNHIRRHVAQSVKVDLSNLAQLITLVLMTILFLTADVIRPAILTP